MPNDNNMNDGKFVTIKNAKSDFFHAFQLKVKSSSVILS